MTFEDVVGFMQSLVSSNVEVETGEDDMIRAVDHTSNAEAFVKYSGGLEFSLQGIRNGEKDPTKVFSFRNEQEMLCILGPKLLECLDGERRI